MICEVCKATEAYAFERQWPPGESRSTCEPCRFDLLVEYARLVFEQPNDQRVASRSIAEIQRDCGDFACVLVKFADDFKRCVEQQADSMAEQLRASMRNFADTLQMALDSNPSVQRMIVRELRDHLRQISERAN